MISSFQETTVQLFQYLNSMILSISSAHNNTAAQQFLYACGTCVYDDKTTQSINQAHYLNSFPFLH